jgi:hypothetical protein
MFESQYNDEMVAAVQRLEAKARAETAGHAGWDNACGGCGCELTARAGALCETCRCQQGRA